MARALAAAIAVSLLAVSGAGGAGAQQTPKRGGTVVFGPVREPSLSALILPASRTCGNAGARMDLRERPRAGVHRWLRLLAATDGSSRVSPTRPRPLHAHVPHSPRGPLERRRSRHRARLRLHRQGVPQICRPDDPAACRFGRCPRIDAKTVRVVLRSRFAGWRNLFPIVLPQHALAGQDLAEIWGDRIDNPKTGGLIGSGPVPRRRAGQRGKQLTLVRNPNYWGTAYRLSRPDRHPLLSGGVQRPADGRGARLAPTRPCRFRLQPRHHERLGAPADLRRQSSRGSRERVGALRHQIAAGHPALQEQARPPGAYLRHRPRSDRPAALRRDRPEVSAERQRDLPEHQPVLRGELAWLPLSAGSCAPSPRAGGLPPR